MAVELATLSNGEAFAVHRFGRPGQRPKVYFQGGLHADEIAPTVALERLTKLLADAQDQDRVNGEIVVVPHCNPIGLKQFVLGRHNGRFNLADGQNFNRGFPDLADLIGVSSSPDHATAIERGRILLSGEIVARRVKTLQRKLMELSWGADFVIDVHADMEAGLHMYSSASSWRKMERLAARLEAQVVILSDQSADLPFDEAHSQAWRKLGMENAVASCTLELRGLSDVSPELADRDATGLLHFLADIDAVSATTHPRPAPNCLVLALEHVEFVRSPSTGAVLHRQPVGARVRKGEVLAQIYDPGCPIEAEAWTDVKAGGDGLIFARWHQRVIEKGMIVCKLAGTATSDTRAGRLAD